MPLELSHHDDLAEAVRDGELWNLWYTSIPSPDRMKAEIERRLKLHWTRAVFFALHRAERGP